MTARPKLITFSYPESPAIVVKPPFENASVNGGSCNGFDTADYFDSVATRCGARMAVQQELGLWTKRGHWIDSGNSFNPVAVAGHIAGGSDFSLRLHL